MEGHYIDMRLMACYCGGTLYRHATDGVLLLCLGRDSADRVMREVHARVYGLHIGGLMLARKILRIGYY